MSDYKNIVDYLDEMNKPIYYDHRFYAGVVGLVAILVIELHTQKPKFLANRDYWLYFDNYRIKLNTNEIRELLKVKHAARTSKLKEYIKKKDLEMISTVPSAPAPTPTPTAPEDFTQQYESQTDKGAAWLVTTNGQRTDHPDLIKNNIKYMFIGNNATWYMEYMLMVSGILSSLYLVRSLIKAIADTVYESSEETIITRSVDLIVSGPGVLALLYYIDQDYRTPEMLNSNIDWKIMYGMLIGLLLIGYFGIRYIERFSTAVLSSAPHQNIQIIILFTILMVVWVVIRKSVSFVDENFSNIPDVIQHKEDEKTIQDLIDEQLV